MHICMFMGVGRMMVRVNITQVLGNPENVCYVCLWALVGWGLVLILHTFWEILKMYVCMFMGVGRMGVSVNISIIYH